MAGIGDAEERTAFAFIERANAFLLPDLATVTDDFELVAVAAIGGGKVSYRGHAGLREWTGSSDSSAWAVMRVHADNVKRLDQRLMIMGRIERRGRQSDLTFEDEFALVFEFERGLIARIEAFTSHEEALRSAG